MPCNLLETQEAACESGIGKLDNQIALLQVIAQSMAATADDGSDESFTYAAIHERACASGIAKLDNPIALLQVIAQNLCSSLDESEIVAEIVESFEERSGITDQTQIAALTALVTSARANGWWELSDVIYPFVGGTAAAHAQNLKSSDHTITWHGTVVHDANGITGNAVDGYGDMGYAPSTDGVQYQLDSGHVTLYRRTFGTDFMWYFGGAGAGFLSMRHTGAGQFQAAVNGGGFDRITASLGLMAATRTGVNAEAAYSPDGSTASVGASTAVPLVNMAVLAITGSDTVVGNFSDVNLAGLTVGGGITAAMYAIMQTDWQTFNTALSRNV